MPERRLSELARVLSQPSGIVSSDFPMIEKVARRMGIDYDLWQKGLLYLMFGKRADGLYACGKGGAVVSICRQVGKTFTIGSAIFILCAGRDDLKVLWTAHRTRTSDETFQTMCGFARNKLMAPYVDHIRRANGQQEISFRSGSRIMFGAREQGFGRGFDAVDMEVFDEAQILTVKALNDMVPAMNVSPNPLLVFMGTPPQPGDPSEQFAAKRADGLAKRDGMLYVEFSADRDADPDDHGQWAKANPSYPKRTSAKAIERMRQSLGGVDNFRREALGIWDENTTVSAIDAKQWEQGVVEHPSLDGRVAYGLDMPPDRSSLAISVAIRYEDDTALINLQEYVDVKQHGIAWAVDWLAERWSKTTAVVVDAQSPAMSLVPDLQKRHVKVTVTQMRDLGAATGRMLDMINAGTLRHLDASLQPQLDNAARNVTLRDMGPNGMRAWDKKGADIDISPLQAATLALHGVFTSKRHPGRKAKAVAL
ncbi:terminase [Bifidobacterium olomucense]|uniref:Terminase n=1 Tax=Bifidobacterium olomucense TaxID=2675324 RepID=A0A7Y0EZN1_9BIFI|nr:terminase [Bifidobacterium sp. DSM 109959]NMM99337.1 terminase [Bifidobacterium sp. DSM 109959]